MKYILTLFLPVLCYSAQAQKPDDQPRSCDTTFMRGDTTVCQKKYHSKSVLYKYYKDGEWLFSRHYYKEKNGVVEMKTLKKGLMSKRHGEVAIFYPDSKLKASTWFNEGKIDGPSLSYYEDGKRHCVCQYKDGKRDGEQFVFHQTGKLYWNAVYEEGRLKEIKGFFDPFGLPLEIGTFKDGNGTLFEYDDTGRKVGFWTYKDGKPTTKKVQKLSVQ